MAAMREVKSCGFMLVREDETDGVQVLVMAHKNRFDLPKGHVEEGESEEQTAAREVAEETGLSIESCRVLAFRSASSYTTTYKRFNNTKVRKTLVIFAAVVPPSAPPVVPSEHPAFAWVPAPAMRSGAPIVLSTGAAATLKLNKSMQDAWAELEPVLRADTAIGPRMPPPPPTKRGRGRNRGKSASPAPPPSAGGRGRGRGRGRRQAHSDDEGEAPSVLAPALRPLVVSVRAAKDAYDVYIGRANPRIRGGDAPAWGNPFKIGGPEQLTRADVVRLHRNWIVEKAGDDPAFVPALRAELGGKVLACWCAPKACHGDFLATLANADDADVPALLVPVDSAS